MVALERDGEMFRLAAGDDVSDESGAERFGVASGRSTNPSS